MESRASDSKMKTPVFSGRVEDFHVWWMRFSAVATVLKFSAAFAQEKELPAKESDSIDNNTASGKKQEAAKKRNALAMAHFSVAFSRE